MKCREIRYWLLSSSSRDLLPAAIERHLSDCADCRYQRQLLASIDEGVRQIELPPANPKVVTGLWEKIDRHPRPFVAQHFPLSSRRGIAYMVAAASVLLALGVFLGQFANHLWQPPFQQSSVAWSSRSEEMAVVFSVLQHDLQLVRPVAKEVQLQVMELLADDLKREAVRLARRGKLESAPVVVDLYELVLRHGVVSCVNALSAEKRRELLPPIVHHLRATDAEVQALVRDFIPVLADMLRPISAVTLDCAEMLEKGRSAAPTSYGEAVAGRPPLLVILVHHVLRLTEEINPLQRAELYSEQALLLSPAIVSLAINGDANQAVDLGQSLGDLLGRGISWNLGRDVSPAAEQIRQRARQSKALLQRNLAFLPESARPALRRAFEAALQAETSAEALK